MSATTRRRLARRSLAAILAAAALPPSVAAARPADYPPRLDGGEPAAAAPSHGRSDAAWRAADEPATPATFARTVSDDGSDLVPLLPGAIVLVVAAGGAGFTLVRMNGRRPGLSH